jgi:uncharacterized protein YndB with AHSA1/START domain
MQTEPTFITVEATVNAPVEKVWTCWTELAHITQWNAASEDWHTPRATNDLRLGGTFTARMEAKDGSMGFDFAGEYTEVVPHSRIAYRMADGREVTVVFEPSGAATVVRETFAAEDVHPVDFQRAGWQSILDNFKKHVESQT